MRKLANFELKAILDAIEHADFTNNYDFFNLLTCGISIEQIRAVYRLRSALLRDSSKTIFDYPLFLDQIYSNVDSFYSVKEALGYEVNTQEIEREDKLDIPTGIKAMRITAKVLRVIATESTNNN
ncbi:hypothetical protein [Vibrio parahaemolyticus]|uniref:hypothetical protein n=1 Tax=Vibrio parahaemolyticus TaxID=670 RepID=UPI001122BB46|nr:hypothetical protein [Vibrio parahaemolyticus]TOD60996.1 hypothetical protein CGJ61_20085 [Vibrio parahaemolyticus]